MIGMGVEPSRKRSRHSIAARASTGVQTAGKALPQLIPDDLTPGEHLHVSLTLCHPMQLQTSLFPPVVYAIAHGITDDKACCEQRMMMLGEVQNLAKALDEEKHEIIKKCHPCIQTVLTQNNLVRHVPLQRELAFICGTPDWGAVTSLVQGLPMIGHAVWVAEMMVRCKPSTNT